MVELCLLLLVDVSQNYVQNNRSTISISINTSPVQSQQPLSNVASSSVCGGVGSGVIRYLALCRSRLLLPPIAII